MAGLKRALPSAHFATTVTTRPPRPGERDGVDYRFLTDAQYDALIAEDGFLERAAVYSHRYGVPKSEVREALRRGQDVVIRVDVQGAATIKRLIPEAVLVFLAPESQGELEQRLRDRATDGDLRLRLDTANREMAQAERLRLRRRQRRRQARRDRRPHRLHLRVREAPIRPSDATDLTPSPTPLSPFVDSEETI